MITMAELPGVFSLAKRLGHESMAREAIAMMLDVNGAGFGRSMSKLRASRMRPSYRDTAKVRGTLCHRPPLRRIRTRSVGPRLWLNERDRHG